MSANIYYVGRSPQISQRSEYQSPTLKKSILVKSNFPKENASPSPQNQSRSTSCPKTQRSRYMQTIQNIKRMSPIYRHNVMQIRKAFGQTQMKTKENVNRVQIANRQLQPYQESKSRSKLSSAFQLVRKNRVEAKNQDKDKKIRFKKVQQPQRRGKHVHWKEYNDEKEKSKEKNAIEVYNIKQKPLKNEFFESIPFQAACKHEVESNIELTQNSQFQSILQYYKIQPIRKLFLCKRCYQFTPIFELKSHQLACKIPLKKQQFIQKWNKVIFLLEECYRQEQSNQLFRLFDRMKSYMTDCDVGKRQGYILYSQELACILSLKGKVQVRCLWEEDLFWLIETLGDLIETKAIQLDQSAFWKICT